MAASRQPAASSRTGPLSTNQRAVREVAREVLRLGGENARLPTALEFQQRLDVGSGTVQKALRILEDAGAVQFRARGHRGRFVVSCDLGALWGLSGLPAVRALSTPPGALDLYGLIGGIQAGFQQLGVHLELDYVRGGATRLKRLEGTSPAFALLSAGAAQHLGLHGDDRHVIMELGKGTYYSPESLVVLARAKPTRSGRVRVGIDRDSPDHVALTDATFGSGRAVDCAFPLIPAAILEDRIDTGVWHRMHLLIPPELVGLEADPLPEAANAVVETIGGAVLVARSTDSELVTLMHALDLALIRRRRAAVIASASNGEPLEGVWFR